MSGDRSSPRLTRKKGRPAVAAPLSPAGTQAVVERTTSTRGRVPAAVFSLLTHAILIAGLAALTIKATRKPAAESETEISWWTPAEGGDSEASQPAPIDVKAIQADQAAVPFTSAMVAGSGAGEGKGRGAHAVDVSSALSGRKKHGASSGSGAPSTIQPAIDASLKWIVRQQQSDGRWQLTGPYPDAGTITTDAGATALALLALIGDGNTHRDGPHKAAVAKGIQWLRDHQRPNGDLFDIDQEGLEAHFYSHAMGTIALCEDLALTGDETLKPTCEKAVSFLILAQNPVHGGWKYRPLNEEGIGDLSVTGWALMALHTARMAKIDIPDDTYQTASRFLDSVQAAPDDSAIYRYRPDEPLQEPQRWSMTAEGLLCRQWLGWSRDEPALEAGSEFLRSERNSPEWIADRRNVYAWYYTAQVLHNLGGEPWNRWFSGTSQLLMSHQNVGGRQAGSWNPQNPRGAFLEWSQGAGRLYFTVMCTLILETPNRHRALYE